MVQETIIAKKPKSEIAEILAKIDDIAREISEMKGSFLPLRHSSGLNGGSLTRLQTEVLRAMNGGGKMTSEEMAKVVDRTRPLMVVVLNQLVALGLLKRVREGRRVYFLKQTDSLNIVDKKFEDDCCRFIVIIACNPMLEDKVETENLILKRFKDASNMRVEHITAISG